MRWSVPILILASVCGTAAAAAEREPALIANACASCHGPGGQSQGAIPSIAGMPADEFVAKMEAFRAGEAEPTIMDRLAPAYSPAETRALADYFANLR